MSQLLSQSLRRFGNLRKDAANQVFRSGQRLGVSVLPRHYYVPVKDRDVVDLRQDAWARPARFDRIAGGCIDGQLEWVESIVTNKNKDAEIERRYLFAVQNGSGPGYGVWDAYFLAHFIMTTRPCTVIEVGAGVSTNIMQWAAEQVGHQYRHICIEPFPSDYLRRASIELIEKRVQDVDETVFEQLGDSDLLFIDSTHTVALGSDVNHLVAEVLPVLAPKTNVHIHDIFFPYLFSRHTATTIFDWQESTLIHALLVDSNRYRMLASLSMLDWALSEQLTSILPNYEPAQTQSGLLDRPPWRLEAEQAPSGLYLQVS